VVSSTPRPYFTPGKDPVPIVQEAGWVPEPVWTGGISSPTGIRSPDRPARSQSLYRLSYPAHIFHICIGIKEPKTGIAIMNISVLKLRLHPPPLSSFDEALRRTLTGSARNFFFWSRESESEYDRISLLVFTD
jgi:hypothetical protein